MDFLGVYSLFHSKLGSGLLSSPHDGSDQLHDDLVQDVEELQHETGLLPHLPHDDPEGHEEPDQTYQNINQAIINTTTDSACVPSWG